MSCAAPEVRVDEHFLRGQPHGRLAVLDQRLGQLHGFQVMADGLLVVGLVAGGEQVAQQTLRAGLHVRPFLAHVDRLLRGLHRLAQLAGLAEDLRTGDLVARVVRLEAHGVGAGAEGLVEIAADGKHAGVEPQCAGVVGLELQGPFEVRLAQPRVGLQMRFGAEHERLGADRLEDDVRNLHRRLLEIGPRLEGEQHAALGIGLPEDLAQLVRHQHRPDVGQVELLGDALGGERLLEADDQRGDFVLEVADLDAVERLDREQLHHRAVLLVDFLRRAPGLLHFGRGGRAGGDAVEAGGLDLDRGALLRIGYRHERFFAGLRLGLVVFRRRVGRAGLVARRGRTAVGGHRVGRGRRGRIAGYDLPDGRDRGGRRRGPKRRASGVCPAGVGCGSVFGESLATTGASVSGGSLGGNSPLRRIRVGGGAVCPAAWPPIHTAVTIAARAIRSHPGTSLQRIACSSLNSARQSVTPSGEILRPAV